jgi:hypothetical protein
VSPEDLVETEVARALDTLGVPRAAADGSPLSHDDRLSMWVRDSTRPSLHPPGGAGADPSQRRHPVR